MESWQALPQVALARPGALASRFAALGPRDLRAAARYVNALPYGRSFSRENPALVLDEGRGTCSSKHALLALLAHEQGIAVELMLGIYEMREANTPGVGRVLERYGIPALPEGHCYLRYAGKRIDITRVVTGARGQSSPFFTRRRFAPSRSPSTRSSFTGASCATGSREIRLPEIRISSGFGLSAKSVSPH